MRRRRRVDLDAGQQPDRHASRRRALRRSRPTRRGRATPATTRASRSRTSAGCTGTIARARACSAESVSAARSGRWARRPRASSRSASSSGSDSADIAHAHRLAELGLVLGRHVPRLLLVRRNVVALVEERLVDHLRRDAGHARAEHAGHRQRVVRVAAEHLEQIGKRWVLELVVVEGADRRCRRRGGRCTCPCASPGVWPSGLNGSGNTSAALPRVHAGNRSPSVESPNQVLSLLTWSPPRRPARMTRLL